jgi:hypothetical protein
MRHLVHEGVTMISVCVAMASPRTLRHSEVEPVEAGFNPCYENILKTPGNVSATGSLNSHCKRSAIPELHERPDPPRRAFHSWGELHREVHARTRTQMTEQHLFEREQEIERQRQRLEQLKYAGAPELAQQARDSLQRMCETLAVMRRQRRIDAIRARENLFAPSTVGKL